MYLLPMSPKDLSLLQGTLDVLVLKALTSGELHGYGVVSWLRETTSGTFEIEEGALYTALHRMEKKGWLGSRWGKSENNRRAKFYKLTARGRNELEKRTRSWEDYARAVAKVLNQ